MNVSSLLICLKLLPLKYMLKQPARNSIIDAAKIWPNIPPPSTQPTPQAIPLCNGCGTKGMEKETSLLTTSLSKAASKFGKYWCSTKKCIEVVFFF